MILVSSIFFVILALLVWFDTEAFIEYADLFSLTTSLFKINEFKVIQSEVGADYSYIDYLLEFHNNFFTRLLSCPICTSVQMGFYLSLFSSLLYFPIISIMGLVGYKLIAKYLL
jgi:hypothetical protein